MRGRREPAGNERVAAGMYREEMIGLMSWVHEWGGIREVEGREGGWWR